MTTTQKNSATPIALDELIKQKGYKKQKIALVLSITEVTFSRKINNPDQFTVKEIYLMAEFLKQSPAEIFAAIDLLYQNKGREAETKNLN